MSIKIAVVLSVLLHGVFFWHYLTIEEAATSGVKAYQPPVVRVVFQPSATNAVAQVESTPQRSVIQPAEPRPVPVVPDPTIPQPAVEEAVMPELVEELPQESEQLVEAHEAATAVADVDPQSKTVTVEDDIQTEEGETGDSESTLAAASTAVSRSAPAPNVLINSKAKEREKARYLALLLAHIEAHKHYPSSARRQGVEGMVVVSFQVTPNGQLQALDVSGGPKLLRRAAMKTVKDAWSAPKPSIALNEPLPVVYAMAFSLR